MAARTQTHCNNNAMHAAHKKMKLSKCQSSCAFNPLYNKGSVNFCWTKLLTLQPGLAVKGEIWTGGAVIYTFCENDQRVPVQLLAARTTYRPSTRPIFSWAPLDCVGKCTKKEAPVSLLPSSFIPYNFVFISALIFFKMLFTVQRWDLFFANLVKQDPGRARHNS